MIAAHNCDADWLMWFHPEKALAIAHRVEQPPELRIGHIWKGSMGRCTHGAILKNNGKAARETTFQYMREYVSARRLQLAVEYLDDEMAACLRVLPDDSHAADTGDRHKLVDIDRFGQ